MLKGNFGVGSVSSSPTWSCAIGGSDVWFVYTATCTGDIRFETCNNGALPETNYDSAIEIFDTDNCADLDASICDDDDCDLQSGLLLNAVEGDSYLIRLGGFNGDQGEGHLEIVPQEDCVVDIVRPIPTLSELGLMALAGVLAIVGLLAIRRRKVAA